MPSRHRIGGHRAGQQRAGLKTRLLAAVALTVATLAAHATEVAPHFYAWGFFSNSYVANSLANAKNGWPADRCRDATDFDRFSRMNTSNYQFYNIMKAANTATTVSIE
jgi:hypothetical protein